MASIDPDLSKLEETPLWKCICSSFIDLLIAFVISTIIYVIWITVGIPSFDRLWLIIFVLVSVLLSSMVKHQCGKTIGDMVCRINPPESMRRKANFWTYGAIVVIALLIIVSSPTSSNSDLIENDTYGLSIPSGWQAQHISDNAPVLECIAIGKNPQNCAYLFTINYNTTGVSLNDMTSMILGGFNRAAVTDIKTEDTKFQRIAAKKITSVLNNAPVEIIAFYAPNGKFCYIMSQNLSVDDRDKVLSNIKLKSTSLPYADFESVWKNFYGDNLEFDINQPIDEGIVLEGWKYNRSKSAVSMKLIIDASPEDIKAFFNDSVAKSQFIEGILSGQIMEKVAKNYNKSVSIVIKDFSGSEVMTLPAM